MSKAILLFDLDGTLTNPRHGIVGCIRHALDKLDKPCPSDDVLAGFIGPPLRSIFSELLGPTNQSLIEPAMTFYRERFTQKGIFENFVYPGIPAMLDGVRQNASALFVATSKPAIYATQIIAHHQLMPFFTRVYGPELDGRFDNKAELLAHLLATEAVPANAAIMVGDRAVDIVAVKVNGLKSIGVLWGYGSTDELTDAGADQLCASPGELVSSLMKITT